MQLAPLIDHTLLRADAREFEFQKLCFEAREHGFMTVCVNSRWVKFCSELLKGSPTVPISVIGFPLGSCLTTSKVAEAELAVQQGAREIDMVIALGDLKDRNFQAVEDDIAAVVRAVNVPVKVILETGLLSFEEKIYACQIAQAAGAHFVKTCTGFAPGAATVQDIQLMRHVVGPKMGVKASGGIRSRTDAEKLIAAGANRIGTSSGVGIVTGISSVGNY